MKIKNYEDFEIWQDSMVLTKEIYYITDRKLKINELSLSIQLKRAIVSVSSNIVEGFERNNNNEFIRFLIIAKGSIGEVRNQLYIAKLINRIDKTTYDRVITLAHNLSNKIGGLISYLEKKRKQGQFISKPKTRQLVNPLIR